MGCTLLSKRIAAAPISDRPSIDPSAFGSCTLQGILGLTCGSVRQHLDLVGSHPMSCTIHMTYQTMHADYAL